MLVDDADRFKAFVVGPGLGAGAADDIRRLVGELTRPVVVDGDGLNALGRRCARRSRGGTRSSPRTTRSTNGSPARHPSPDRLASARELAAATGGVALLKGSTTVVADGDGRVLVTTTGTSALATAGSGDVLSGIIGALCAGGLDPLRAAAAGSFVHGLCGLGFERGLVAGDLPERLPAVFSEMES